MPSKSFLESKKIKCIKNDGKIEIVKYKVYIISFLTLRNVKKIFSKALL